MPTVYLGIGTNLGNRVENIEQCVASLAEQIAIDEISPIYETAAWGYEDQPNFLNLCLKGRTELEPWEMLHFLKDLELRLGREKTFRWGPRLIDIDILFLGDVVMSEPGLTIPHKSLAERAFVLVPLADIAPDLVHPVSGETVKEMLSAIDAGSVSLFEG